MYKITKTIKIFKYSELNNESKTRAINDHIQFLIETSQCGEVSKNLQKAFGESEKMQTPWFIGEYIYKYCKDEIIKELNDFTHLRFLKTGALFY